MSPDIDDPDLTLAELFREWPAAARVFIAHGTACVGCPIAPFHGVRDTCAQYRLDEATFRAELRAAVAGRSPAPARALRPRPRPRPQQGES